MAGHLSTTVAELEERLSASELSEWKAYFVLQPFGDLLYDYQGASVARVIAAVNTPANSSKKPKLKDFLAGGHYKTPEQQEATLDAFFRAMGA